MKEGEKRRDEIMISELSSQRGRPLFNFQPFSS